MRLAWCASSSASLKLVSASGAFFNSRSVPLIWSNLGRIYRRELQVHGTPVLHRWTGRRRTHIDKDGRDEKKRGGSPFEITASHRADLPERGRRGQVITDGRQGLRISLNAARSSSVNIFGFSQAAK